MLPPVIILWLLLPLTLQAQDEVDFTSSNLPIVVIDTRGQEIPAESPRIRCYMGIIWNGPGQRNEITDPFNDYYGLISIKIHGASSSGWMKKSYSIETEKADSSNNNVPLLGMPKENDWILQAPYYDRSLMRNVFTYRLVESWGHYAPRTRYCELVINGKYKGIYVLTEKIKRDKHRVDIKKMDEDDNAGDSLTGGYIFKSDKEAWKPNFPGKYRPTPEAPYHNHYQYVYPKPDDITPSQKDYIKHYFWAFEDAIQTDHPHDPESGYPAYLNVGSFVDYFLISELAKNVDSYYFSCYFHKDRDSEGGKITMGPVWDYNFAYGNVAYNDAEHYTGWELMFFLNHNQAHPSDPYPVPFWWNNLIHDSLFVERVISRWHELRQSLLTPAGVAAFVDAVADTLDESKDRNFTIWIGPGDPPASGDGWFPPDDPISNFTSYADEINYLKMWTTQRIRWIDDNVEKLRDGVWHPGDEETYDFRLLQNQPNPFTDRTTITYEIPFQYDVQLKIYSLTGHLVTTLIDERQSRGRYEIVWQPYGHPAGIYILELRAGPYHAVKKMSIIR
jgi:hypothetical protein